jgi:hypothetical protein
MNVQPQSTHSAVEGFMKSVLFLLNLFAVVVPLSLSSSGYALTVAEQVHSIQSITKSVVAMAFGILVEQKGPKIPLTPIHEILPGWGTGSSDSLLRN